MSKLLREEGRAFFIFNTCTDKKMCYVKVKRSLKQKTLFSFPLKKEQFSPWFCPWSLELEKDFCALFGENKIKITCFWDFQTFKKRAELVEPDKQILCNRPWNTLFCPIEKLQVEQDPLFANLYVDPASLDDNNPSLNCATPSNDGEFYNTTMRRL